MAKEAVAVHQRRMYMKRTLARDEVKLYALRCNTGIKQVSLGKSEANPRREGSRPCEKSGAGKVLRM
jgi:hypothetical protein